MENHTNEKICIDCSAANCVHHEEGDHCNAKNIHVGNCNAHNAKETCCDTFKDRG